MPRKIQIFRKSRPFCSARPCFAATSLKFPLRRGASGELKMLLLRRGFAFGELDYLRSCPRCSFLLSCPPASSFSSSPRFLRGSPASRVSPYPPASSLPSPTPRLRRSPRGSSDYPGAALEASTIAAHFSDPTSIGCVTIRLSPFARRVKTLSLATLFAGTNLQSRTPPSKGLNFKSRTFFYPLCIGLAKIGLEFFSR